jgi:hypothetical protein
VTPALKQLRKEIHGLRHTLGATAPVLLNGQAC